MITWNSCSIRDCRSKGNLVKNGVPQNIEDSLSPMRNNKQIDPKCSSRILPRLCHSAAQRCTPKQPPKPVCH